MAAANAEGARWQAVEALIDAHADAVMRYARQRTGDDSAAESLFVDTFLQAYRVYPRRPPKDEQAWLLRLADGLAREQAKRRRGDDPTVRPAAANVGVSADGNVHAGGHDAGRAADAEGTAVAEDVGAVRPELRIRLTQLLLACEQQRLAERRHRGPAWIRVAAGLTFLFAAAAISYGAYRPTPLPVRARPGESSLSPSAAGLPVIPQGQFRIPAGEGPSLVRRIAVDNQYLYVPSVRMEGTGAVITVRRARLQRQGKPLDAVLSASGTLRLHPPAAGGGWDLSDWHLQVTGPWVLAVAEWTRADPVGGVVTQIYGLHWPSGRAGLVKSLGPVSGESGTEVVAAGAGRLVIQRGIGNPSSPGQSTTVSSSVEVFRLHGADPGTALGSPVTLHVTTGLMRSPVVTQDGIVFQGVQAASENSAVGYETWYHLDWQGRLEMWQGPPNDGQPHWVACGQTGDTYWVETTPDTGHKAQFQVLMGLMKRSGERPSPASSLDGTVTALTVTGGSLVWIPAADKGQLVVARAN
ncbi:MAG: sigma-70 family RNA polymerase sigma factor [Alicyclobacillaceae bacterium]|nr:sigma-70 family RNA polymerase sigma factor [Alicyclobacillaceae bacterium]